MTANKLFIENETTRTNVVQGPPFFDRKVEFLFGVPGTTVKKHTDLRIAFKFKKTSTSVPNQGTVKVWNLSPDSRSLAETKGTVAILRAGYGENVEQIFVGDVSRAITDLEGPDLVTSFEFGDGEKAYKESLTNISFSKGTDIKDVFTFVINSLGKTIGDVSAIKSEKLLHGITLSGTSREQLDYLCSRQKLEWSIQDDVVQVVVAGGTTKETAILLSKETGLIGVPKKNKDGNIELQCLLQPKIKPGRAIRLESSLLPFGNYRVNTVETDGDNFAKQFYTKIEAVKI